jgi:hypothetical protein
MSEVDFQNGLVVGLTLAGKNGAVGGVAPPPAAPTGGPFVIGYLTQSAVLLPVLPFKTDVDYPT